jgi:hypothetical protein
MHHGAWISNELPGAFPDIARRTQARGAAGHFLMSLNGEPVAWTDPHSATLQWVALDGRPPSSLARAYSVLLAVYLMS